MPRSLIAWLSGLIVSRGISQVSAMILTTVSNVDDIGKSLIDKRILLSTRDPAFRRQGGRLPACVAPPTAAEVA
jgi:hypothetical protein